MYFVHEIKEGLIIAFRAIRANKMRSVLTTLGIVIGIVSVTLMATAIEGVDRAFEKSASAFGSKVLYIQRFPWVGGERGHRWSSSPACRQPGPRWTVLSSGHAKDRSRQKYG